MLSYIININYQKSKKSKLNNNNKQQQKKSSSSALNMTISLIYI